MSAADAIGARRVTAVLEALARQAEADLPRDVTVEIGDGAVIVSGRRLIARSVSDERLRRIGR